MKTALASQEYWFKGAFSELYYCYGNLLCQEKNDNNTYTNDGAGFDTRIVA